MADSTLYNFPDQTISETKKTQKWHMDHVRHYISARPITNVTDRKEEIESMYRAYLCMMNEEEQQLLAPVTKPYGANLGVDYMIYNLIEQKIEQLVGDYMDRPLKRKSYVLNKKATNRKLKAKIDTLAENYFRQMNEEFEKEYGIALDTENPEIEIPEDIEEFFAKNYKDIAEEVADDLMEKFLDVDKQKREIVPLLRDYLISDQAHLKIYEKNGIVQWQKAHPLDITTDKDPHKVVQDDHEYFVETEYLSKNEIFNTYELDKQQKQQVENDFNTLVSVHQDVKSASATSWINDRGWYVEDNKSFRLAVVRMTWKSRKELRVKVTENKKTGEDIWKKLNDDDRVRDGDKLIKESLETERHCVMIGHNLCLSWGLADFRNYRVSDKKKVYLNFVSIYRQNPLGVDGLRSVAAKLKKLQDWASEQLFELRLATRRNQGKVMVYDTAQIPRQYLKGGKNAYGNALNRVMHHVKKDQIIFMNSKEKNNRFNYNQFTHVDLSTTGLINDIIAGMALIEDLADKMIGLTPARQGQSGQYTTATNVESQRASSFSRTEVYYRPFDDFIQTCLERVTQLSKYVYKENDNIHYVLGDMKTKFLTVAPEFMDTDLGWYLSDGGKDAKKKQIVDQAAQLALGNAQTEQMILSLIDVLSADTAVESRGILDRAVAASEKLRQENSQQEQEALQAQIAQKDNAEKRKEDISKRGQDVQILVAEIYANQKNKQVDRQTDAQLAESIAKFEQDNIKKPTET